MNTIVRHRRTGNKYILLGANGIDKKQNLSPRSIGDLFSQDNAISSALMTVCDVRGNIFLMEMEDLIVIEIDGKKLSEMLPEIPAPAIDREYNSQTTVDFNGERSYRRESVANPPVEDEFDREENTSNQDFDDDEDFDDELEREENPPISSTYSKIPSQTNDFDDDEDWI